jgi:hypothetical protein
MATNKQKEGQPQPQPESETTKISKATAKKQSRRLGYLFLITGLLILALAIFSFWSESLRQRRSTIPSKTPTETSLDSTPSAPNQPSPQSSDEIGAIEKDISQTNLDNLDQELNLIEQELSLP